MPKRTTGDAPAGACPKRRRPANMPAAVVTIKDLRVVFMSHIIPQSAEVHAMPCSAQNIGPSAMNLAASTAQAQAS